MNLNYTWNLTLATLLALTIWCVALRALHVRGCKQALTPACISAVVP